MKYLLSVVPGTDPAPGAKTTAMGTSFSTAVSKSRCSQKRS